jgi:hypothetical protein
MNQKGPCHGMHDGWNSSFSTGILVVGTDAGEGLTFPFFVVVAPKHLRRENTIIIMIG